MVVSNVISLFFIQLTVGSGRRMNMDIEDSDLDSNDIYLLKDMMHNINKLVRRKS